MFFLSDFYVVIAPKKKQKKLQVVEHLYLEVKDTRLGRSLPEGTVRFVVVEEVATTEGGPALEKLTAVQVVADLHL
jgi:hypothetical protein